MNRCVGIACAASLLVGCATAVEPGLANGPRLGGLQTADEHVHDVVSNGGDSCGRFAEQSPLRLHWPACPTPVHPMAASFLVPPPGSGPSVVGPWLQHFYLDWLTRSPGASGSTGAASR